MSYKKTKMTTQGVFPESKVHGANMGPTWVLSAPDGPHAGRMNLAIRVHNITSHLKDQWGHMIVSYQGHPLNATIPLHEPIFHFSGVKLHGLHLVAISQ